MDKIELLNGLAPQVEAWFRDIIRDEVQQALDADRAKAKPEKMFSRDEVCGLLHISKPTLWQKTKEGEINATRVGRRVLYSESAVNRYLGKV